MLNDLKVDKSGRNIFFPIHIFQSTSPTKLKILDLQKILLAYTLFSLPSVQFTQHIIKIRYQVLRQERATRSLVHAVNYSELQVTYIATS